MAGESLFDTLAGGFGHAVNRPALNSFVNTSQAMNGLRSAQTEEALNNAQKQQEEMAAHAGIKQGLLSLKGPDGNPLFSDSDAELGKNLLIGHYGSAPEVMKSFQEALALANQKTLSDKSQMGSQAQTAAQQGLQGKVAEPVTVPKEYTVPPGAPEPVVHQTPLGEAETRSYGAGANLKQMEVDHPEYFHTANGQILDEGTKQDIAEYIRQNPSAAQSVRQLVSNGAAQVISTLMHPERYRPGAGLAPPPGTVPPAAGAPSTGQAPPNGIQPAPGVSFHEQAKIRDDFASGVGARQATALNTMNQHAKLFDLVADSLQNGNFTPSNAIKNLWARAFGSAAPSNLQTVAGFLGREAVRATVNSGAGTGQERELQVSDSDSPEALHGAAATLRSLAAGQLHSLDRRARRGGVDITQLLDPETITDYGLQGHSAPVPGAAQTPTPTPQGGAAPASSAGVDQAAARATKTYATEAEAQAAETAGHLNVGDKVIIGGRSGSWSH